MNHYATSTINNPYDWRNGVMAHDCKHGGDCVNAAIDAFNLARANAFTTEHPAYRQWWHTERHLSSAQRDEYHAIVGDRNPIA